MDKKLKLILISLSSAISTILVVSFAFAWTNPTNNPPGGGGVLYYSGGNVGISDSSPASLLTVGSGDLFQVNSSGDLIRIKNIAYAWPSSQGAANTALINNGAGTFSWSPIVNSVSGSNGITASPTTGAVGVSLAYSSKSCGSGTAIQSFNVGVSSSPTCVSVGGSSGVTGSGNADYITKWTGATSLGNSSITTSSFYGIQTSGSLAGVYAWGSSSGYYGVYGVNNNSNSAGVRGDGGATGVYGYSINTGVYGQGGTYGVWGSGSYAGIYGQGGTYAGIFNGNVDVYGTVRYYAAQQISDIKFKKDIQPIQPALNKISSLQSVSFNWKKEEFPDKKLPDGKHYGLIAQEVEKVIPELVQTNAEGEKSISYTELIPFLIEAVKEQQNQINSLKSEVELLKVK